MRTVIGLSLDICKMTWAGNKNSQNAEQILGSMICFTESYLLRSLNNLLKKLCNFWICRPNIEISVGKMLAAP